MGFEDVDCVFSFGLKAYLLHLNGTIYTKRHRDQGTAFTDSDAECEYFRNRAVILGILREYGNFIYLLLTNIVIFLLQMLPKEELYTPPLNIRVRDNRQFGRKPMVGVHVLKSLEKFRCQPLAIEGEDSSVDIPSTYRSPART